ncbi:hydroxypyruvate isomerase family protein [Phaeovulum sp.]|uniref:hydroxypyruvate isomerase family protein n=1 Tax=Phaeovulum sp. TaxID=2934796 RepID=UPI0039E46BC5
MPRFAANLTFLFTEHPFMARFKAAKEAGFDAVEVLFPYEFSAQEMRARLVENGLTFVLLNVPPPNWAAGDRGFAAVPGAETRFRHDFERALRFADVLNPHHIHIMSGRASGAVARATYVKNLRWAAQRAPTRNLTIEPLNPVDMPGYFLSDFDLAAEILDEVAAPNLGLQFDAYHAQMLTGSAAEAWQKHRARATHVQIAGAPGRHEPSGGDIDYPAFFKCLDAGGYTGFVSAEYNPARTTKEGLGWLTEAKA